MGRNFEADHRGVSVKFNFGGSQNLRTQLEQGARADVFASANEKEMSALIMATLVESGTEKIFATNQLVVILPAENPAQLHSLQDLAQPGLKMVLAAEEVPVGYYTRQVLDNLSSTLGADFKTRVLGNLVSSEDNVRQVVTKVQLVVSPGPTDSPEMGLHTGFTRPIASP